MRFTLRFVIDTSALVAVLVGEPEREALLKRAAGAELLAPGSVHWEIGNALVAMLRRRRATLRQVEAAIGAYDQIPLRLVEVSLSVSAGIAAEHGLYAYDAYVLACAQAQRAPLLTLDRALARVAAQAGIELAEV